MNRGRQIAKYVLSDYIAASVAWFLFNIIRYKIFVVEVYASTLREYLQFRPVITGQILIPFFWLIIYYFSGYYNRPFGKSRFTELVTTFMSVLIGTIIIFFVMMLDDIPVQFKVYYQLFASLLGVQFVLTYIPRLSITLHNIRKIKKGELAQNVLIIGVGGRAKRIAEDLRKLGYNVWGHVRESETISRIEVGDDYREIYTLSFIMETEPIDEIVIALESENEQILTSILYSLYEYKCTIKLYVDKFSVFSKVHLKTLIGIPLIDVTDNNFSPAEKNIKFFLDKVLSAIALIVLSPLFVYLSLRIKKDSRGPILFRQERIGYRGEPFIIYKFRTMYVGSENQGPALASENDLRITPFGKIMRKYRIDELPQFWNVIKGDMSLVGPRPERKYYIDQILERVPSYSLLHNVRPGITSLGMVKYGYADSVDKMIERMEYDILYYENMSLALDMKILIYTIKTVITGKGI